MKFKIKPIKNNDSNLNLGLNCSNRGKYNIQDRQNYKL